MYRYRGFEESVMNIRKGFRMLIFCKKKITLTVVFIVPVLLIIITNMMKSMNQVLSVLNNYNIKGFV
jgi:hypothetical protein